MPRIRAGSATATHPVAESTPDQTLHQAVTEWLEDCYRSDGVYASHITNLTHCICDKSPELRTIRFAIRTRMAAFLHFCLRVIAVGAQQGLPVVAAVAAGSLGWRRIGPSPVNATATATANANAEGKFTPYSFNGKGVNLPSAEETWTVSATATATSAGSWLGEQVHGVLTLAWSLVGSFLDRSLHLQEAAGSLQNAVLQILLPLATTALLSVAAYWGTYLFLTLVLQIHTLAEKEHTLRRTQGAFLEESKALVERTLVETLRPPLLHILGNLLAASATQDPNDQPNHVAQRLTLTYSSNYELLRSAIYDELIGGIRGLEFSEILAKNRLSALYFQELFFLMRNADEDVGRTLFRFNQALSTVEGDPLSRAVAGSQQRIQAFLTDGV